MGLLTWLGLRRDVIRSPLSPAACAEALSADIDGMLTLFGDKPAFGKVGPHGGRLRKRIRYRNDFQTVLYFSIDGSGGGSLITARSGLPIFATIFLTFWFGMISLIGLAALSAEGGGPGAAFFALPMLGLGVGLLAFCRWLARGEHDFLLAFIAERVDGRIETPAGAGAGAPIVS